MKSKSQKLHNILLEIVERKREDFASGHPGVATTTIGSHKKDFIAEYNPPNGGLQNDKNNFIESINNVNEIAIISEIKFASPTNPLLGSKEELLERAKKYEEAGAN